MGNDSKPTKEDLISFVTMSDPRVTVDPHFYCKQNDVNVRTKIIDALLELIENSLGKAE